MTDSVNPKETQKTNYSYESLFIKTKKVDEIINSAKIVIDTNVLLSAYQTKPITFTMMLEVLSELSSEKRLLIPSHVIWEFSRQRPKRIETIVHEIQGHSKSLESLINFQAPKQLVEILPALEILEETHEGVLAQQQSFRDALKDVRKAGENYRKRLKALIFELAEYLDQDPIITKYENIIKNSYFNPSAILGAEDLDKEGKRRAADDIPPGLRDKSKGTNKYGDLIIWLQICEIKDDVIFITFDNKDDWVYRESKTEKNKDNNNNRVIGARRELVEEFYKKSGGKTFKILHPADFLEKYKADISEEVKDDLKSIFTQPIASGSITLFNATSIDGLKGAISSVEQEIESELQKLKEVLPQDEYETFNSLKQLYSIIREINDGAENHNELNSYLKSLEVFSKHVQGTKNNLIG